MELKKKKVAMFLENIFEDVEFMYPNIRMKEAGANVTVIAPKVDTYNGKHGLPARSDISIDDANAGNFDALIIPGGYSPDLMRRHNKMVDFVKEMNDQKKIVAAICHAPWMLASADIVKDKKLTSFFSLKDDMIHAGANWIDEEVVKDGNIITSRSPNDLPAFCKTIITALSA
jgi:protease I